MGSARRGSNPLAVVIVFGWLFALAWWCEKFLSSLRLFRLAVRTSRCGRDNPGSNPGRDIVSFVSKVFARFANFVSSLPTFEIR